jgi:hypothetical protein
MLEMLLDRCSTCAFRPPPYRLLPGCAEVTCLERFTCLIGLGKVKVDSASRRAKLPLRNSFILSRFRSNVE